MATLQTLPEATTFLPGTPHGTTSLGTRSFFYAVFKHRALVLGVFLIVFGAATIAALLRPRSWRADTKVLVKLGEMVQVAPAETPSRSINLPLNQEVVKTEAEIVKGYAVVKEAVERVGVTPAPGQSLAELVSGMQMALSVAPTPGSNVLRISYLGRDPERAANMVNAITDVYLEHHNRVYRNEGVHSFYTKQLGILTGEMKRAQKRLRSYLKEHQIVDVDQELTMLNDEVHQQERALKGHSAKLLALQGKVAQSKAHLAGMQPQVPYAEEYVANPTNQTFKGQLAQLEIELSQLNQRYLPEDRLVRDKEAQIAALRKRISQEDVRILNRQTLQRSPLYDEIIRHQQGQEMAMADLTARGPVLQDRLRIAKRELRELRDKRFVILNLKRAADEKTYALDLYRKKREEARIQEAMTNQSMVNVSVVEQATPPLEPENGVLPPILVGLLGGLGLATGMAVAVEYLNRRLRFEEEVERYLELPVLAVIPDLETTSNIAQA